MTDEVFVCLTCGEDIVSTSEDDIGTVFYKCSQGHVNSKAKALDWLETIQRKLFKAIGSPEYAAYEEELKKPLSMDFVLETLGTTVKRDDENKAITFLCMLANYTREDQVNLGFLAESSTGKSYIPLEVAKLFPKSDLIVLGYCSPTAFFHEWGTALPDPTDLREDVEPEKRRKIIYVDLEQKILIFLDQPHSRLLENLRPLLSHDKKEMTLKISDRRQKSGLRTKTVVIRGYPTVIFCSAKFNMDEQEKTRLLLLSPEVNQEKLRESIFLKLEKDSDRGAFYTQLEKDPNRLKLKYRIDCIKKQGISQVLIPVEIRAQISERFMETHKVLMPRHQRDIGRLLTIIKGAALLNFRDRNPIEDPIDGSTKITVNMDDALTGFQLYGAVSVPNELGIPPEIYEVYKHLLPAVDEQVNGVTRKDFQRLYFQFCHKILGGKKAIEILHILDAVGLLTEIPDPNDRRVLRYIPQEVGVPQTSDEDDTNTLEENTLPHTIPPHHGVFISDNREDPPDG
jgi:hypothetical protein